ncbi:MAG: site-specific DNA-methyltransferase [Bacteroidia bacterium]
MSTQVDLFTTVEPTSVSPAIAKPFVSRSTFYQGDCLVESQNIQDGSVDLILTDLPYGVVKMKESAGNYKVLNTAENWDKAIEPKMIYEIANKLLRKNGKMVLFSQEPYTSKMITEANPNVPFCYRAVWEKNDFANGLGVNKAMVSFYEDILMFSKNHDTEDLHPLRNYLKDCKQKSGLTNKQLNYLFSEFYNKNGCRDRSVLEHYWAAAQFTIPTQEIYKEILQPTGFFITPYEDLKAIDEQFKNDFASVFNLWENNKYKSNILKYKKDYDGYHPTQKPVLLLEDLIRTFSNENDLVVDLTMGSGSTGVACKKSNRHFIGIEKDEKYFKLAVSRVSAYCG